MKRIFLLLPLAGALAACSQIPHQAFFDRGDPASLLDVSSEVVTMQFGPDRPAKEIADWIERDQPTRAELFCQSGDKDCATAEEVLTLYGVEYVLNASNENMLNLIYERVAAHDCEHRFVDDHINPYNLSHPAYGCSIASNMVQMISDRRQFTSPALLEPRDADRATREYRDRYLNFDSAAEGKKDEDRFRVKSD